MLVRAMWTAGGMMGRWWMQCIASQCSKTSVTGNTLIKLCAAFTVCCWNGLSWFNIAHWFSYHTCWVSTLPSELIPRVGSQHRHLKPGLHFVPRRRLLHHLHLWNQWKPPHSEPLAITSVHAELMKGFVRCGRNDEILSDVEMKKLICFPHFHTNWEVGDNVET